MKSAPRRVITKKRTSTLNPTDLRRKPLCRSKLGVSSALALVGKEHIRRCTQVLQGATVVAVSDINADNARAAVALPGVKEDLRRRPRRD